MRINIIISRNIIKIKENANLIPIISLKRLKIDIN